MIDSRTWFAVLALAGAAAGQQTVLVDELPGGGSPAEGARYSDLTSGGREVVFDSLSEDLVAADVNGARDVFLRDMQSGVTEIVSLSSSGVQGDADSTLATVSPDGHFVAFSSKAKNFTSPGQVGGLEDVFLRDRTAATTTLISVSITGGEANGLSWIPDLCDDGTRIAFQSSATDLVAGDDNGNWDVFVHDTSTGATTLVSRALGGGPADGDSTNAAISGDGRHVTFTSTATNLSLEDTNPIGDIYVHDLETGLVTLVSIGLSGQAGNGQSFGAKISADGQLVIFQSSASDLVVGDTNGWQDIFLRDMSASSTELISKSQSGIQATYSSNSPQLSSDGLYATFNTGSKNLTTPPTPYPTGAVRVDLGTGEILPVGLSSCGIPILQTATVAIAPDGSVVAITADAAHVVPDDLNQQADVFLHDPSAPATLVCTYCSVAPTSHGCMPTISGTGTPSLSASTGFVLSVNSVEGKKNALFVHGYASKSTPWGVGPSYLCLFNAGRFGPQNSGGTAGQCDGTLFFDWNGTNKWFAYPGGVVFAQAWFRDPPAQQTTHLSNALSFVVGP